MTWAHYILQVNIYLVVFYGFYKLLLDKETYFLLNRIYLVAAGILSLAIPFLRFEWFTTQPATQPVYTGVVQINDFITQMAIVKDDANSFNLGNTLVFIYLTGILFSIVRFIFQLISVQILLKRKKSGSAFSFFKKKVVDQNLPQVQTIQRHEEIHIRQWHTLDVLFFEVVGIITWFNPVIYFYKTTVKHIHEYLADEEAASYQGDKEQYALLLLSSAFGIPANTLTNSFFNKSLIKKRIYMLHKQRSRKTAMLKYGMFVPLFAVTLIMSSATIRNNEKIKKIAEEIPLEEPLNVVKEAITDVIKDPAKAGSNKSTDEVLQKAVITNKPSNTKADIDWTDFYTHLKRTIRYPAAAYESKVQGNSQIKFIVKNGEAEEVSAATSLGSGCDTEVMRAILSYPKFKSIPDGKYTFNAQFKLIDDATQQTHTEVKNQDLAVLKDYIALPQIVIGGYSKKSSSNNDNPKVYDFVSLDKQPSFPGGMEKFYEYLKKTVKYPQEAQKNNIQGKVFLSFIVETDGELTDIKVDRSVGSGLDEEAVRVIEESPKWIPGMKGGQNVRVKYNIPISFSLSEPKSVVTQGKVQGIQIKDNKLTIGGSDTKPLYVIDGEKQDASKLLNLNPNDIESVEVLKDKSATALYGDAGKDGVIKVTTKTKQAADLKKKEAKEKKN
jgi:TonB family C-terminal domain